jgi:hypothetical protein
MGENSISKKLMILDDKGITEKQQTDWLTEEILT